MGLIQVPNLMKRSLGVKYEQMPKLSRYASRTSFFILYLTLTSGVCRCNPRIPNASCSNLCPEVNFTTDIMGIKQHGINLRRFESAEIIGNRSRKGSLLIEVAGIKISSSRRPGTKTKAEMEMANMSA
jgi:hypothetical protein